MRKNVKEVMAILLAGILVLGNVNGYVSLASESDSQSNKITSIQPPVVSEGAATVEHSYLYFGSYPQSEVTGEALTEVIIGAQYNEKEDGIAEGVKYRRVLLEDGSYKYFRYEPICWKVIGMDGTKVQLRSEYVLAAGAFDTNEYTSSSYNWTDSTLRHWLNGFGTDGFLQEAFTLEERSALIGKDLLDGGTLIPSIRVNDLVYIQAYDRDSWLWDMKNYKEERVTKATDYAFATGITDANCEGENVWWWLRVESQGCMDSSVAYVSPTGAAIHHSWYEPTVTPAPGTTKSSNDTGMGICPAITIDLSNETVWRTVEEMNYQNSDNCSVTDIQLNGNDILVKCTVERDCRLVAAVYDTDMQNLFAVGETLLKKGMMEGRVNLEGSWIENDIAVQVFMIDAKTNQPLCKSQKEIMSDVNVVQKGQCGENVYFSIDDEGTLKIYGEGNMMDYDYIEGNPFSGNPDIRNVIVCEGVESIGAYAFKYVYNLESIQLPASVLSINQWAFSDCDDLKEIVIPASVSRIGSYAFAYCDKLESVIITDGVQIIDEYAFYECIKLTELKLPDTITEIGEGAFSGCDKLKELELPEGITSVAPYLCSGCKGLERVVIPDGVKSIGKYAFHMCTGLVEIVVPDGFVSVGDNAFYNVPGAEDLFAENETETADISVASEEGAIESNITRTAVSGKNNTSGEAVTVQKNLRNVTISAVEPGEDYLFVVVKDKDAEELLSYENLIYINQYTADASGEAVFSYVNDSDIFTEMVFGRAGINGIITSAAVVIPDEDNNSDENGNQSDELLKGDVNKDKQITLNDAQMVLRFALRIETPTAEQRQLGDMDEDLDITLSDAQKILRMALKIE